MTIRLWRLSFLFIIVLISLAAAFPVKAQSTNLIANGSLEISGGGAPQNWTSGYWGSPVPVFSYPAVGSGGTKGASITLSANSTGDANWQPIAPATVTGGATYTYRTSYNSNVATEIDAEYISSSGAHSYVWVATVPSSGGVWKQISVNFTVPSGITKATVYQLIFYKGTLTIDDVSLAPFGTSPTPPPSPSPTPPPPAPAPTLSFSATPSTITAGQSSTLSWTSTNASTCTGSNGWSGTKNLSGTQSVSPTITTTYVLSCTGTGGTISKQTTVSISSVSPPPAPPPSPPPPPAPTLTFSASPTSVVAGQSSTLAWSAANATSCTASNAWSGTKATSGNQIVTPPQSATYVLSCTGLGGSISKQLNVTVATSPPPPPSPTQFSEGMVTLSFDDAWASQYTNALPILQASGLPATFYFISSVIQNNSNFPGYMTPPMATTIASGGYEIADHTITHPDLTTLSSSQVVNEITASRTYLQSLTGKSITSIAYPYGSLNSTVKNLVIQAGYTSGRGVDDSQLNTPSSDRYNLFSQCIENTESVATIESWINKAKANKQWYILCFHEIGTTVGGQQYSMPTSEFQTIINYIKQTGIKVVTVSQGRALMGN